MERTQLPVDQVLDYWFGDALEGAAELERANKRWFSSGHAQDHEIAQRFADLPKTVAARPVAQVAARLSALAAVIVLDQFPRHLYRGQAGAFAFDDKALEILDRALKEGWDRELHPLHTSFLYMPLQHVEDLQRQEQGVSLYTTLFEQAEEPFKMFIASNLDYAHQHLELIQRFGRFPHRNQALGRESTEEERRYLEGKPARFGQ